MRKIANRLTYVALETRRLLAGDFAMSQQHITLDAFSEGQIVSVFQQSDSTVFYLPNGTWNGQNQPGIGGSGTPYLSISDSVMNERSLSINNSLDSAITDIVFAGDVILSDFSATNFRSISQTPGTELRLSGWLDAESTVFKEPGNVFERSSFSGKFLDLASSNSMHLISVDVDFGRIESTGSVKIGSNAFGFSSEPLFVREHLSVTSGDGIDIIAERIGVTGELSLKAPNDISIDSTNQYLDTPFWDFNGFSVLNRLNFQSDGFVSIEIDEIPAPFESPGISTITLYGQNRASNLHIDGQHERITNAAGTALIVDNHAYMAGRSSIYLAAHSSDTIHIGKRAHFESRPVTSNFTGTPDFISKSQLVILRPGDVKFGWFRSNQSNYVTVFEDDSSYITSIGGQRTIGRGTELIYYTSGGNLETHPNSHLESDNSLSLVAEGQLTARTSDSIFKANTAWFDGGAITVDHIHTNTVTFISDGNVRIRTDSDIRLKWDSRGHYVDLRANRITSLADATLTAKGLSAHAESIWLANHSTNEVSVSGRATFNAEGGFVVVGRLGSVNLGQVNFNTRFADVRLSGHLQLAGSVRADDAVLSTSSFIGDSLDADIQIGSSTTFRTPRGVLLADGNANANSVVFCGHVFFDVGEFAIVKASGTSYLESWTTSPGAFVSIAPSDEGGSGAC